ncbi:MAG TPA: hypothetical protein VGR57_01120, partial [Ktedonobacterales bacterium]|nr:hypothetical protein [Ktedonobacterales bacterium]
QANLIRRRSVGAIAYTAFATIFALVFAADLVFNTSTTGHFTRSPITYLIINVLLLIALIYDVVARRTGSRQATRMGFFSPLALAVDFSELAIVMYVAAVLVNLLRLGSPPFIVINLNQTLGLHLPDRVANLQDLDAGIALSATALMLLFLGIVGGVASGQPVADFGSSAVTNVQGVLGNVLRTTWHGVSRSLRLVLGPLIYVGAGLSVALLAQQIVQFFQQAQQSSNLVDLLNPFSATSQARYQQGLLTVLLTAIAVVTIILAVALVEQNATVLRRTIALLLRAGQTTALTLAFFMFSLAFLNAALIFFGVTRLEPFQVSAPAILALVVAGGFMLLGARRAGTVAAKPAA